MVTTEKQIDKTSLNFNFEGIKEDLIDNIKMFFQRTVSNHNSDNFIQNFCDKVIITDYEDGSYNEIYYNNNIEIFEYSLSDWDGSRIDITKEGIELLLPFIIDLLKQ